MRPTKYAFLLAVGYAFIAVTYIVVSSSFAASEARSVDDLARLEMTKGVIYVAVTGAVVFVGAKVMAARLAADARKLVERERALVITERRGLAGLLASSVAHDCNNVLTGALADIDELRDGVNVAVLDRLEGSTRQLVALQRRLLQVGKQKPADEKREIDVGLLVGDCVDTLKACAKVKRCQVRLRTTGVLTARAYPVLVHQLVSNLVLNAAEATEGRGVVEIVVLRCGGEIVIEVHDDGPGIPPERRGSLFDALVTTKVDGSGLGLFSVKACAETHGGNVEALESPLGGACFRVSLPAGETSVLALA